MHIDDCKEVTVIQTADGASLRIALYELPGDFSVRSLSMAISVDLTPFQARQLARDLLNAAIPMFKADE